MTSILDLVRVRYASGLAALGLLVLAVPLPAQAQDECSGAGICGDASVPAEDLLRRRVNRTLAVGPAEERFTRLDTPGTSAVVPFEMRPDGNNTNFQTSLSQWSASLSAADEAKLKAASEASEAALPLPQKVTPAPSKFDLWAKGRREDFGDVATDGNALTTFMGADYRVDNDLLVGGMVQLDEARQTSLTETGAAGSANMTGPYLAYRVTPHITFDAKTAWGMGEDNTVVGDERTAFTTQRMLSEAKVTGQWGWQGWQLSQSGGVSYLDETTAKTPELAGTSVDVTRLSVGPELKRRFEAGETSIEPFAFFKSSVDLSGEALADPNALNTIGGGITFVEPDSYSIRATAGYSESTASTDPGSASGKVSVSVPTAVLDF